MGISRTAIQALKDQRNQQLSEMRQHHETLDKGGDSDVAQTQYDECRTKIAALDSQIKREQYFIDNPESERAMEPDHQRENTVQRSSRITDQEMLRSIEALERAMAADEFSPEALGGHRNALNHVQSRAFLKMLRMKEPTNIEQRSLNVDGGQASYAALPLELNDMVIKHMDDMVHLRSQATVIKLKQAQSLGVLDFTNDLDYAAWSTELSQQPTNSDQRELNPHELRKLVLINSKLLHGNVYNVQSIVAQRMAYKLAAAQENAFLNGDGVGKPLGIFPESPNGVSAARNVTVGSSATGITFDGLKNVKWSLKSQYHKKAAWFLHRETLAKVDLLKDTDGRYLWKQAANATDPETLLGLPICISEFAPKTSAVGDAACILGDMSCYMILENRSITFKVLQELYAIQKQVGLLIHHEADGQPILGEAFARGVYAA